MIRNHTAHPHVEADGSTYNVGIGVGSRGPKYLVCKFPGSNPEDKGNVSYKYFAFLKAYSFNIFSLKLV